MSGSSQGNASIFGFFPFGMPSQGIPSVPLILPLTTSTSMMSWTTSFQGFPFGIGHIPHSNLTVGSMPFPFTGQGSNPFQSWTNPVVSGIGSGNQFFGQQGNVSYSLVNSFWSFPPLAKAWNPYQGFSTLYNNSLGGNFAGYRGVSTRVGQTLSFVGP